METVTIKIDNSSRQIKSLISHGIDSNDIRDILNMVIDTLNFLEFRETITLNYPSNDDIRYEIKLVRE